MVRITSSQPVPDLKLKRTTTLSFINLKPIPGLRQQKPWDSAVRFGLTFKYPVVVLTVVIFCFAWYWWLLSIITMIPAAYAQYSPSKQGLLFLGLLLGASTAELLCSGTLSDWLVDRLSKKQGQRGVRVPEKRLWLAYPSALLSASKFPPFLNVGSFCSGLIVLTLASAEVGLVLWGVSIDKQFHWAVGQVAFFLCQCCPCNCDAPESSPF
jgi:hypothetical protein